MLSTMLGESIDSYENLTELERSAMIEIGNIMISTFINAMSGLADQSIGHQDALPLEHLHVGNSYCQLAVRHR